MKLKNGFITHRIQDTQMMVAAGEAAKHFNGLVRSNETAAFIINCLKNDTTEEDIVEKILSEYDVSREIAAKDVKVVLEKLYSIGAIE